jgi:hypothetical protein
MEKVKLIIPTSWDDVNVRQYIEISKIDTSMSDLQTMLSMVRILVPSLDEELMNNMTQESAAMIVNKMEFISTQPVANQKSEIVIKGDTYVMDMEFEKLSVGEMVSFETLAQSEDISEKDSISLVLAILLRKKVNGEVEEFDADNIFKRREMFDEEISITDVYGFFLAFANLKQDCI